jgi:membrane associated rhomboid family serine protease
VPVCPICHTPLKTLRQREGLFFRWLQIPAWGALGLWLVLQFAGVFLQLNDFSNVAATAHLGGAATGFALWHWWGKCERAT